MRFEICDFGAFGTLGECATADPSVSDVLYSTVQVRTGILEYGPMIRISVTLSGPSIEKLSSHIILATKTTRSHEPRDCSICHSPFAIRHS